MDEELITLTRSQLEDLLSGNSKSLIMITPTTPKLLFENTSIRPADIRNINEKFEVSKVNNLNICGGTTFSKNQNFNYEQSFDRKVLRDHGPYSKEIHDLIRKLTLAVMGEKLNKNVSYEDWNEARSDYVKFKQLFLKLYEDRLSKVGD